MGKRNGKEKGRGIRTLLIVSLCSAVFTFGGTFHPSVDLKRIILEQGIDFQYNLISTSAIIGGFLFTGVSIFISTIENGRIKRMWDHNYFDNLYRVAILGILLNVLTIFAALVMIIVTLNEVQSLWVLRMEIVLLVESLILFVWNVLQLVGVLKKTKNG